MNGVPHHGEEHSAHRTAPPAAEMAQHLETDGLSTFHVSLTQALQFQRDSRPQSSCLGGFPAVRGSGVCELLWLSCLRDAILGHPHSSAANSTPLYCTGQTLGKPSSAFSRTGEQGGSSHSCCKCPFFLQQQKSDSFHVIS